MLRTPTQLGKWQRSGQSVRRLSRDQVTGFDSCLLVKLLGVGKRHPHG